MKILKTNAGDLTNFEVLDLLRSRGAGKDPTRVIASVSPSEFKVYGYIEKTSACNQTHEIVHKCVRECKKYDLDKTEILNVIMRPFKVFVCLILDEHDARIAGKIDEFITTITQILPPHPSHIECDDGSDEDEDEHETTQI